VDDGNDDPDENKHNVRKISSYCEKTFLDGYCKPETSYAQFECLDGYELDEGFLEL
jgi:hypothetical protein